MLEISNDKILKRENKTINPVVESHLNIMNILIVSQSFEMLEGQCPKKKNS